MTLPKVGKLELPEPEEQTEEGAAEDK